ncbi:hypothetical protein SO802_023466 [Lithocarpus litseifolius]|uniref:Uncharacterized protein n=1 Tax=Lithocarpus litseifolius TaxID=425828 RepID=A0AAW2C7T4_9ROSI
MATNKTEKAKMVRNLDSDVEEGCCGCTKIEPNKVVYSGPGEEQLSSTKQGNGSVFPAKKKSVLVQILKSLVPKSAPTPQSNNKVDCCRIN